MITRKENIRFLQSENLEKIQIATIKILLAIVENFYKTKTVN